MKSIIRILGEKNYLKHNINAYSLLAYAFANEKGVIITLESIRVVEVQ